MSLLRGGDNRRLSRVPEQAIDSAASKITVQGARYAEELMQMTGR